MACQCGLRADNWRWINCVLTHDTRAATGYIVTAAPAPGPIVCLLQNCSRCKLSVGACSLVVVVMVEAGQWAQLYNATKFSSGSHNHHHHRPGVNILTKIVTFHIYTLFLVPMILSAHHFFLYNDEIWWRDPLLDNQDEYLIFTHASSNAKYLMVVAVYSSGKLSPELLDIRHSHCNCSYCWIFRPGRERLRDNQTLLGPVAA